MASWEISYFVPPKGVLPCLQEPAT